MIELEIHIENYIPQTRDELARKFQSFMTQIAEHGAKDIQENFTTSHVPSWPGEPPAIRTGFLKGSVDSVSANLKYEALIEIGAYYSVFLEFGNEKIAPRPFVRPAVHRLELAIPRLAEGKFGR